jgi:hypothetical protein
MPLGLFYPRKRESLNERHVRIPQKGKVDPENPSEDR